MIDEFDTSETSTLPKQKAIRVHIPDYDTYANFPADTSDDTIREVLSKNFPKKSTGIAHAVKDITKGTLEVAATQASQVGAFPLSVIGKGVATTYSMFKDILSGGLVGSKEIKLKNANDMLALNKHIGDTVDSWVYKPTSESGQAAQHVIDSAIDFTAGNFARGTGQVASAVATKFGAEDASADRIGQLGEIGGNIVGTGMLFAILGEGAKSLRELPLSKHDIVARDVAKKLQTEWIKTPAGQAWAKADFVPEKSVISQERQRVMEATPSVIGDSTQLKQLELPLKDGSYQPELPLAFKESSDIPTDTSSGTQLILPLEPPKGQLRLPFTETKEISGTRLTDDEYKTLRDKLEIESFDKSLKQEYQRLLNKVRIGKKLSSDDINFLELELDIAADTPKEDYLQQIIWRDPGARAQIFPGYEKLKSPIDDKIMSLRELKEKPPEVTASPLVLPAAQPAPSTMTKEVANAHLKEWYKDPSKPRTSEQEEAMRVLGKIGKEIKGREDWGSKLYSGIPPWDDIKKILFKDTAVTKFIRQNGGRKIADEYRNLTRYVNASAASKEAKEGGSKFNEFQARVTRAHEQVDNAVSAAHNFMSKLSYEENYEYIKNKQKGSKQRSPELQSIADSFATMQADHVKQVDAVAPGALGDIKYNYAPQRWTRDSVEALHDFFYAAESKGVPADAIWGLVKAGMTKDEIAQKLGITERLRSPRPSSMIGHEISGPKSFLHKKVIPDFETGLKLGLEPITKNAVEMELIPIYEMQKFLMMQEFAKQAETMGLAKLVLNDEEPPRGFDDLEISTKYLVSKWDKTEDAPAGTRVGRYYFHPDVAVVINNSMSKGLFDVVPFSKSFRSVINSISMSKLALGSVFHGSAITYEAYSSKLGLGYRQLYQVIRNPSSSNIAAFMSTMTELPATPVKYYIEGRKLRKGYLNPALASDPMQTALMKAGARFTVERSYRTNTLKTMRANLANKEYIKLLAKSPAALAELLMKPVMEHYVPNVKWGAFQDMMADWMRRNPNASASAVDAQARWLYNRVEGRMGEINWKRLNMHKGVNDLIHTVMFAPGWTLGGTIVEGLGAVKDILTGTVKGRPERVTYVLGAATMAALTGAVMTYLATGESPHGLDFIAGRTGRVNDDGTPERAVPPLSMIKDTLGFHRDPTGTALNKINPGLQLLADTYRGVDARGYKIENRLEHIPVIYKPIGVDDIVEGYGKGESPITMIGKMALRPVSPRLLQSKGEAMMADMLAGRKPVGGITEKQVNKDIRQAEDFIRRGETLPDDLRMRLQNITDRQLNRLIKDGSISRFAVNFNRLTLREALKVYAASPEHRDEVRDMLESKIDRHFDTEELTDVEIRDFRRGIGLE